MNKVFTFYPHTHCDGCNDTCECLPVMVVITVDGAGNLPLFLSFKQFCSEECRDSFVEELNSINGGFLAFGYEVVKGGT